MEISNVQQPHERWQRVFIPIIRLAAGALVVLTLAAIILIGQFNQASREREQQMLRNGFAQKIEDMAALLTPMVDWDDAVRQIDGRFDAAWVDKNITTWCNAQDKVQSIFILGDHNQPIYGSTNGRRGMTAYPAVKQAIATLLPQIRAREASRPPMHLRKDAKTLVTLPIQASTIAIVDGRAAIVIASLVQPDLGTAIIKGPTGPIIVTVMPIDQPLLDNFGARYMTRDIRQIVGRVTPAGKAVIALNDAGSDRIVLLMWTPQPGMDLLTRLLLPLVLVTGVFGFVAWNLVRQSSSFASDLISSEARARHLAFHDSLTHLPNRALMFDRLGQMLAHARRDQSQVAVHFVDLDRFKAVNDTLGHPAGDELIRQAGERLASLCRETDTVARLGGDEFVILQSQTDAAGARQLAERLIAAFMTPFELASGIVTVGCSVGISVIANPDLDPAELLRQADLALYRSKDNGRNRATLFEPKMDAALQVRRALEQDLRKALSEGALYMAYQPQTDENGIICGAEALLRWTHPERGTISPAVFVPLAEECGMILELGEFVIRRVFEETRHWLSVRVAINVSALQLRSPLFIPMISRLMTHYDIAARHYEIEITETALLGDDEITRDNITMLKEMGFTLALDDFGTGYSSLSSLQRFSVDKIKIDRSFVSSLCVDQGSDSLINAIVNLGQALKLEIIAEGVETQAQHRRLIEFGCMKFQGYLFSQPVASGAVEAMLAEQVDAIPQARRLRA